MDNRQRKLQAYQKILAAANQPPTNTTKPTAAPPASSAVDQRPPPVVVRRWLDTEPFWKNRLGEGWVGKKMLGSGSFGTVGHWTYKGSSPSSFEPGILDIAVKQAVYLGDRFFPADPKRTDLKGLASEAGVYGMFKGKEAPHIPRMYRELVQDTGMNQARFDYGTVHRIYLEYFENGSLEDWVEKRYRKAPGGPIPIPEDVLWRIFYCLARALLALETGSEEIGKPAWTDKPIIHFDIKPPNILVTGGITDTEHKNRPAFKIGDLGLARIFKAADNANARTVKKLRRFGTPSYMTPEQVQPGTFYDLQRPWNYTSFQSGKKKDPEILSLCTRPTLGSPSNVWQIGLIMYQLMMEHPPTILDWGGNLTAYRSTLNARLKTCGDTIGTNEQEEIEEEERLGDLKYSVTLHALVAECLLVIPDQRPSPARVVERTGAFLDVLPEMQMAQVGQEP